MKRLFIIAGETSGDTHGAGLMAALQEQHAGVEFHGLGGPKMHALAGDDVEDWIEKAAVVGLVEVLKHYPFFRRKFNEQLKRIAALKPDAVVLIDYPGFNLRMAKALRSRVPGLKIVYYISPQVWAWNRGRIPKMAQWLDLMICIFPFEVALYNASGLNTVFGGHPMTDHLETKRISAPREHDLIGLFPGSREREVARLFPLLLDTAKKLASTRPRLRFAAAASSDKLRDIMVEMAGGFPVEVTTGSASDLMQCAAAGIVASGTATLEAAFFGLPYCLVYKVAQPTYLAARQLVKVPYLGIVNILAGREVVREFIQADATPETIAPEIARLLNSATARAALQAELAQVVSTLGGGGAYRKAADLLWQAI